MFAGSSNGFAGNENRLSGNKLPLKFDGVGTWVMEVDMSGEKTHITVDSGAADSVSPIDWGSQFPMRTDVPKKRFVTAGGKGLRGDALRGLHEDRLPVAAVAALGPASQSWYGVQNKTRIENKNRCGCILLHKSLLIVLLKDKRN